MPKAQFNKKHYLAVSNSRQVIAIKESYGEATKAAELLPGGHVLEVSAKSTKFALRYASKDHGYSPSPYLVQELGIQWEFS